MALFKFRLPGQGDASDGRRHAGKTANVRNGAAPAESVESLRQRARHRVIGATVLVVAAVLGFPMLFDTEPRPISPDVAFHIPDRDSVSPMRAAKDEPVRAHESLSEDEEVVPDDEAPVNLAADSMREQQREAEARQQALAARERAEQAERERQARERAQREQAAREKERAERLAREKREKAERAKAERAKAEREKAERERRLAQERAARERAEKAKQAEAAKEKDKVRRFIVQVGSFEDEAKAKAARSKLESAGIRTYVQIINTKDGKRTRVRVGPFGSRSEAEALAQKVKALGLYAGIAEL